MISHVFQGKFEVEENFQERENSERKSVILRYKLTFVMRIEYAKL